MLDGRPPSSKKDSYRKCGPACRRAIRFSPDTEIPEHGGSHPKGTKTWMIGSANSALRLIINML